MAVLVIIAEDDAIPANIPELVKREYPDHFQYNTRTWFVSAKGLTTKRVAASLGINADEDDEGEVEGVAVFRVTASYWGNANADLWEWLKVKFESA